MYVYTKMIKNDTLRSRNLCGVCVLMPHMLLSGIVYLHMESTFYLSIWVWSGSNQVYSWTLSNVTTESEQILLFTKTKQDLQYITILRCCYLGRGQRWNSRSLSRYLGVGL